jgi:hypothetical protein
MFKTNHRLKIKGINYTPGNFFKIIALVLIPLFIVIFLKSCDLIPKNDETVNKAEGYVRAIYSNNTLENAEVQLLGWYESWLNPGNYYSFPIDTVYTDSNGYFEISFKSNLKNGYSLNAIKDKYFVEEGIRGPASLIRNVNISLFPHGYVKTHITNKIVLARWIDISIVPKPSSGQFIYCNGFINTSLLTRAFTDTTFVTTTIGGMNNELKILMTPTESTIDNVTVKDTSFLTRKHDTVYLNLILK